MSGLLAGHHENPNMAGVKNITGKDEDGKKMEQNLVEKI